jgi:hypothetical protein
VPKHDYPLYEILAGTFQAAVSVLACPAFALAGLLLGQIVRWGAIPDASSFFPLLHVPCCLFLLPFSPEMLPSPASLALLKGAIYEPYPARAVEA